MRIKGAELEGMPSVRRRKEFGRIFRSLAPAAGG
jgi:hypothetical protein